MSDANGRRAGHRRWPRPEMLLPATRRQLQARQHNHALSNLSTATTTASGAHRMAVDSIDIACPLDHNRCTPMQVAKPLDFSSHALEKMLDRGATEAEVRAAVLTGSQEPARKGRVQFRKNFAFNACWRGKQYAVKQVAPLVAEEPDRLVVVTVYTFYY